MRPFISILCLSLIAGLASAGPKHKDRLEENLEKVPEAGRKGIERARASLDLNPDDPRALYLGATALVQLGERAKGLEWAGRAAVLAPTESSLLYNVACAYSVAGEKERALDTLEQAVQAGFSDRGWLETDSELELVREDPRFQALLQQIDERSD